MRTAALLVFVLLGAGCQDTATGIQTLCNAPRDCAACKNIDPAAYDRTMSAHIDRSVRNADARALHEKLANVDDAQRAKLLREAAEKAGLSQCILADRYEARAKAWEAHQRGEGREPAP